MGPVSVATGLRPPAGESAARDAAAPQVRPAAIRHVPYPYRALLAICSDLDLTPDWQAYVGLMRFLNTTRETPMGPGVGLEVGNSIYFDMPPGHFSYWNTGDEGRDGLRALIRSGHVDCLHSFGDLAATRAQAARALDDLSRHDCRLSVWVDHAVAPSNFGADIMAGSGDVPGSPVFHADLTCAFGIEYVWRGRVTSVAGQDAPWSLGGLFSARAPARSALTVAKEALKGGLARAGHAKYAMHAQNGTLRRGTLRSGQPVIEFLRSNPHPGGVSCGETASGLAEVLTSGLVDRLVDRDATCILYTHLGKVPPGQGLLPPASREALRRLACDQADGRVLVTTTRRALGHCRARLGVTADAWSGADGTRIRLHRTDAGLSLDDLQGLTIYVEPGTRRVSVEIDGREIPGVVSNPPDRTGRASVSLPFRRLEFPLP